MNEEAVKQAIELADAGFIPAIGITDGKGNLRA
jgi:hypothetical protein